MRNWKLWLIPIAGLLLCAASLTAGAKEDLSITPAGSCSTGGTAFAITNNSSTSSIHATVAQITLGQSTVTNVDVVLQPRQQQQLGCATQNSSGRFLVRWQVQSAQYQ